MDTSRGVGRAPRGHTPTQERGKRGEGVARNNDASGNKLKYLRRIPLDPMTGEAEWGMRSYQDEPTSQSWGGQNVFDVFTKSDGVAFDGTKYKDW